MREKKHRARHEGERPADSETGENPPSDWESEGGAPPATSEAEERPAAGPEAEPLDYKDKWLRAEADLQNFRRRAHRETEEARRRAEETALLELVSWLDDLERAIESASEAGASAAWVEGVSLVLQKGRDYLTRQGVAAVDPLGERFDPVYHEAILEMDSPEGAAPGSVVQVVQKGYRRGDRSLRAARVIVASGGGA